MTTTTCKIMYRLIPHPAIGQRSFYDKAIVIQEGDVIDLYSYMSHVISLKLNSKNNVLFFNKELYSKPTVRHIKSFLLSFKCNIDSRLHEFIYDNMGIASIRNLIEETAGLEFDDACADTFDRSSE